jgi:signal transduction histidine kinase
LHHRSFDTKRIEIRRDYASAPPVTGFPVELRQVFLNLIGNAIQAMPMGGRLGVSVRESTDWTRNLAGTIVSIQDTGNGIQPEDVSRLFQPFFSTKSTKGTGLGLWISKGIIQKYNGRISCRSFRSSDGCVTSFRVFLPSPVSIDRSVRNGSEAARTDHKLTSANRDPILQIGS